MPPSHIKIATAAVLTLAAFTNVAHGGILSLDFITTLDQQLADPASNFHPQGLGYDSSSQELLFMQQSAGSLFRTDLSGTITGTQATGHHHTTSVASDQNYYYFSDYTGNSRDTDLYAIDKASGGVTALSSEVTAYGGYPIDVRAGNLYRTENTINYDWGSLSHIRVSALTSVDTIVDTIALATSNGIGDIAVDHINNSVWIIDYAATAQLREFDLTTGNELASFALGLDGLTAGLTYANNKLYYYDWNSGSASTLSAYSITRTQPQTIPEPVPIILYSIGLVALAVARKQS